MEKKQKLKKNIVVFVIIIISIIGLGYLLSGTNSNPISTDKDSSTSTATKTETTENIGGSNIKTKDTALDYIGKIVYLQKSSGVNNICVQESKNDKKIVYTDKDEELKIKSVKSITSNGKVLAVLAPNDQLFGGKLYLIPIDGSGKKELLVDEFASPQTPVISSNAKSIAYILFSNIEEDFGFSLNSMNVSGKNKLQIDHDDSLISYPAWSPDSKNIAYIKGNNPNMKVFVSDDNGTERTEVYSIASDKKISGLSWSNQNIIILTLVGLKDSNNSEIISADVNSKKTISLLKDRNNSLSDALLIDEKKENFIYLQSNNSQQDNNNLNIGNRRNDSSFINTANSIIGWIEL